MATSNVVIAGATYPDVPAVTLNKSGGGTSTFTDVSDTTAAAADVAQGKYFYTASGVKTEGTASGGGGGGNPTANDNDVVFVDYDGTIRYSYTAAEFANLTALPTNPTHDGLTAQGWNWTLADAKTYVASYGGLVIGQNYITSDGKTRVYIELSSGALTPYLGIGVNGTATIEWGDGTSTSVTGSSVSTVKYTQHTYSSAGEYIIKISAPSGNAHTLKLLGKNGNYISGSFLLRKHTTASSTDTIISNEDKFTYLSCIKKIEIGERTDIGSYGLGYCYGLRTVTIPRDILIEASAFSATRCLLCVVPPPTSSYDLGCCSGNYSLCYHPVPNVVLSMTGNNSSFYSLKKMCIPPNLTSFATSGFSNNSAMTRCCLPEGLTTLSNSLFQVSGLQEITIPSSVTSIGSAALNNCYGLNYIKFKPTTPPSPAASNVFNNLPTTCKIYVPSASLNTYKTATNYPSSSTYTYIGY